MATSAAQASASGVEVEWLPTDSLLFDPLNPRLREEVGVEDADTDTQQGILLGLWRDFAVDEVALSIAANGYFPHEPLFVAREAQGLVVIEGNRRLAAVKLLRDAPLRRLVGATDLPRIAAKERGRLDTLPALILDRRTRHGCAGGSPRWNARSATPTGRRSDAGCPRSSEPRTTPAHCGASSFSATACAGASRARIACSRR